MVYHEFIVQETWFMDQKKKQIWRGAKSAIIDSKYLLINVQRTLIII